MDILEVTKKDLFSMKLRDEPIEIDMTHRDDFGRWAEPEHITRLWELGVMIDEGNATITTHRIISVMKRDDRIYVEETPCGKVLGSK